MFENLDKYLPLYYRDENGEFQELGNDELDDIFGIKQDEMPNPFSLLKDFIEDILPAEIVYQTTSGGSWTIETVNLVKEGKYEIRVTLYNEYTVPVYIADDINEAEISHNFYVAAFKAHTIKKLTNIYNGDIINIEIKNYGEEIDET